MLAARERNQDTPTRDLRPWPAIAGIAGLVVVLETRTRTDAATLYPGWILACTIAEATGMTAAAAAAVLGHSLGTAAALSLVVAGGLVEGVALGWAQSMVLGRLAPRLARRRYLLATALVAGLGWAGASAPAALSGSVDTTEPSLVIIVASAAGLGLVIGAVLGWVQAVVLRGAVRHPWRWVAANAAAWPPAMVVIMLGATAPSASWPAWPVLVLGPVTGVAAGGLLGVMSGWFLPSLSGASATNRVVLALLTSHRRSGLQRALVGLEVRGRVSGPRYHLPVQYAVAPGGLAVVPARATTKTWWRNIDPEPTPVALLREGVWAPASARLVTATDPAHTAVVAAYRERWPRTVLSDDQPVVLVQLGGSRPFR